MVQCHIINYISITGLKKTQGKGFQDLLFLREEV